MRQTVNGIVNFCHCLSRRVVPPNYGGGASPPDTMMIVKRGKIYMIHVSFYRVWQQCAFKIAAKIHTKIVSRENRVGFRGKHIGRWRLRDFCKSAFYRLIRIQKNLQNVDRF